MALTAADLPAWLCLVNIQIPIKPEKTWQNPTWTQSERKIWMDPDCSHWSGLPIFKQKLFQWQNCFKTIQIWIILTIQDVGRSEKLKKGQKNFWRPNKGQRWKNPNFHNFFDFLRLIGSKNWRDALFFHFQSHKGQKGHYKAKS